VSTGRPRWSPHRGTRHGPSIHPRTSARGASRRDARASDSRRGLSENRAEAIVAAWEAEAAARGLDQLSAAYRHEWEAWLEERL
jgi:hypothetical protein